MSFTTSFLQVCAQVAVLFLLMGVGFIAARMHMLTNEVTKRLNDFVLLFVAPSLMIVSFQIDFDRAKLVGLGITALLAIVMQAVNIILSNLLIHDKDKSLECVLRFGAIFSNCGFMGLPLDYALFGSIGVFYGSVYIAIFNIISWSYGIMLMSKGAAGADFSLRKMFLNPGVVGVSISILLFLLSIRLPAVIYDTLNYVGSLNTPLPMFIIGAGMAELNLADLLRNRRIYPAIILRMLFMPLIAIAILYFLHIDATIAGVCLVGVAAPTAALTNMFAMKYGRDSTTAIAMISLSTLLSIITIPFFTVILQLLLS